MVQWKNHLFYSVKRFVNFIVNRMLTGFKEMKKGKNEILHCNLNENLRKQQNNNKQQTTTKQKIMRQKIQKEFKKLTRLTVKKVKSLF